MPCCSAVVFSTRSSRTHEEVIGAREEEKLKLGTGGLGEEPPEEAASG
jgi:hypothetical protein